MRGTLAVAALAILLSTAPTASAQLKIRAQSAGFVSATVSNGPFGIRSSLGESASGFSEGGMFKAATGFLFADPGIKVPNKVQEDPLDPGSIPSRFQLDQNYPNPFNPVTTIRYDLPEASSVDLRIYELAGRLVRILEPGVYREPGRYEVTWDGRNDRGGEVATGIYFCRIDAGRFHQVRRMVLIR